MNGSEYIAEYLNRRNLTKVFLVTGGSCAFMIDALERHPNIEYVCFQHEQAAAMAADAVWRVDHEKVGVTMATSGPGATNLITGIACSYFDSIPSIHITGQVNKRESSKFFGANVRQAGFQETNIVEMVKPVTKYAIQVNSIADLKVELEKAYHIAVSGRMGPVLIDVPMNVQQEDAGDAILINEMDKREEPLNSFAGRDELIQSLNVFFQEAKRPLVLFGAGVGLANIQAEVIQWLEKWEIPFVSSWNGMTYFNHDSDLYCGHIGVYGNRGANYIIQNCDALLVLGSRLDNRQRSGNTSQFAPGARVHVIDVDGEELKKYAADSYAISELDFMRLPAVLDDLKSLSIENEWMVYLDGVKGRYFGKDISQFTQNVNSISPYQVVQSINRLIDSDAVVIAETGASLCWVFQVFHRTDQILFTAGGMSPMGYALPAAIGAALTSPGKQVVCFVGDGGFQMNIQELQTIKFHNLDVKIVLFNNQGYGMIKQFQDSYMESRYAATGNGYSQPDFRRLVTAYGLNYLRVDRMEDINEDVFQIPGATVLDVTLHPGSLIEPKLEMGRPINDQFPYVDDDEFNESNRFVKFDRVQLKRGKSY